MPKRSTLVPHSKSPSAINANHLLRAIARISVGKKLRVEDGSNRVVPHLSTRHLVAIHSTQLALSELKPNSFVIMKTPKGYGGPKEVDGVKIEGNCASHQVPLPKAKTDEKQLHMLEEWLKSYNFKELYDEFTNRG